MKKFTFHTSRAKGSPRSYSKTEDKLNPNEINLLVANVINEYNKLPIAGQMLFLHYFNQALQDKMKEDQNKDKATEIFKQELNDLYSRETGDTDTIESELKEDLDTQYNDQTIDTLHGDSRVSSERTES